MSQTNLHNAEASKSYFDQWHLYQQVIQNDYMSHKSIAKALNQTLSSSTKALRVLDLGCGDASAIANIFNGITIEHYTGVDIAGPALALATENLSKAGIEHSLVEADFAEYVENTTNADVDVIMIGFALHHLHTHEKQALLEHCARHLVSSGKLVIYDIFKRDGESLDDYLDAYTRLVQDEWTALSTEAVKHCIDHVRECDFPETVGDFKKLTAHTDLTMGETVIFSDNKQLHRAIQLIRQQS